MKYLKAFENFSDQDLGRFSNEEDPQENKYRFGDDEYNDEKFDDDEYNDEEFDDEYNDEEFDDEYNDEEFDDELDDNRKCNHCGDSKIWGDEGIVENKRSKKPISKKEKELASKYSPKNKITKADIIQSAKDNAKKATDKNDKGLTKAQKKLPEGLRKAIEAKRKKK